MEPLKRKRSSILRPAEKRVSFNDTCIFKELHQDGTCDITNLFLPQDMDLTNLSYVEPIVECNNKTVGSDMDVSCLDTTLTQKAQTMDGSEMDISLVSQFINTMPKSSNIDLPKSSYSMSMVFEKSMNASISMTSDISSLESIDQTADETFFGAFHDSNNISYQSNASDANTLINNAEMLNGVIHKIDHELEKGRQLLDTEMKDLFKFYRHVISQDNKYEFAVRILGLRHSIWLIFKINPDNYPNEIIHLRFAINKRDKHLYPSFALFAAAVRWITREGRPGYLTNLVINAQKFRRFLRISNWRKPIND